MPTDISKIRPATADELKQLFALKPLNLLVPSTEVVSDESDTEQEQDSSSDDGSNYSDYSGGSSDSDSGSSWGSDFADLEAEMNVILGKQRSNSSPALLAMEKTSHAKPEPDKSALNLKQRMYRSESSPYLQSPELLQNTPTTTRTPSTTTTKDAATVKPSIQLEVLWGGLSAEHFAPKMWNNYFLRITADHVRAHTHQVERAIRDQDLDQLQDMLEHGESLQTCNRHGESTLHIAARRGSVPLMSFLLRQAKVTLRIRDDVGRSPLHDACWSHKPDFDLIRVLLEEAPECLLVMDKRGFTPLCYCPRATWGLWATFFQENKEWLRDLVQNLSYQPARDIVQEFGEQQTN